MAKMTTCKTCGQPIAKNAKVCPHCGAKMKKHTLLKIIAAVVVLGMIGSVFGGRKSPDAGQNGAAAVEESETARAETQAAEESPLSDETAVSETESVPMEAEAETTQPPAEEERVSETASPETAEAGAESTEVSAESTEAAAASTEVPAEDQDASADGVTPELKKFLDEYEAFMNDYCDFMETYDQSDTSAMMEYLSLLQKYADFAEAADAYDQDEMSDADLKYYLEVTTRIEKRLLEVSTN